MILLFIWLKATKVVHLSNNFLNFSMFFYNIENIVSLNLSLNEHTFCSSNKIVLFFKSQIVYNFEHSPFWILHSHFCDLPVLYIFLSVQFPFTMRHIYNAIYFLIVRFKILELSGSRFSVIFRNVSIDSYGQIHVVN